MKWIDLYNFLYERANDINNVGQFPWQEEVKIFDWETLQYYNAEFIELSDKISLSVDTYQKMETT